MEPYFDNPSHKTERLSPFSDAELAAAKDVADAKTLRKQKARRVCRALHRLALLGLVVYLVSRYVSFPRHGAGCHHKDKGLSAGVTQRIGEWDYDIPGRTQIVRCAPRDEWKPSDFSDSPSEVSFNLPLDSAKLFLLSRGRNLGGKVTVETREGQAEDQATVKVKIYYHSDDALDWTKVCLLESAHDKDENGVGIFTPMWGSGRWPDWKKRNLSYAVTVTLPTVAAGEDAIRIKAFETDLPNTSHFLQSLDEHVIFESINLRGTNGFVRVESLTTLNGEITTTNGKITGHVNGTDFLSLTTTNGPIDVDVNFTNDKQENSTLAIHTTNSPLKASISLLSTKGSEGSFYVSTTTTNGPLAVDFPSSPVDSILKLGASTTNSPAKVALDAAYEGSFSIHTSRWFQPSVYVRPDEVDPSGQNRPRVTHSEGGRGEITGTAQWGTEEKPQLKGGVIVTTTNGPVSLEV